MWNFVNIKKLKYMCKQLCDVMWVLWILLVTGTSSNRLTVLCALFGNPVLTIWECGTFHPDLTRQRFASPSTSTCICISFTSLIVGYHTRLDGMEFPNSEISWDFQSWKLFILSSFAQPAACPLIQWHPGRKRSFLHLTTNTNWQRIKQVANKTLWLYGIEKIIFDDMATVLNKS